MRVPGSAATASLSYLCMRRSRALLVPATWGSDATGGTTLSRLLLRIGDKPTGQGSEATAALYRIFPESVFISLTLRIVGGQSSPTPAERKR